MSIELEICLSSVLQDASHLGPSDRCVSVNLLARTVEPSRRKGPLNTWARRLRFAGAERGAAPVLLSATFQVLLGKPRIGVRGAEDTSHVLDHVFVHPKRLAGFLGRRGIRLQYRSRDVLAEGHRNIVVCSKYAPSQRGRLARASLGFGISSDVQESYYDVVGSDNRALVWAEHVLPLLVSRTSRGAVPSLPRHVLFIDAISDSQVAAMLGGKYAARATLELQRRADAAADSFAVDPAARAGPGKKKVQRAKAQRAKERAARKKKADARRREQAERDAAALQWRPRAPTRPLDSDDDAATVRL